MRSRRGVVWWRRHAGIVSRFLTMAAVLATLAQAKEQLGIPVADASQDVLVQANLDRAESLFVAACGRTERPFQIAQPGRVEYHDGTGRGTLFLDYPAGATVTEILIGPDFTAPSETVDLTQVIVEAGRRRLTRIDGGRFGAPARPRIVRATYDAGADLPIVAQLAVLRGLALLMQQRGLEGVKGDRVGGVAVDPLGSLETLPGWAEAVDACRDVTV